MYQTLNMSNLKDTLESIFFSPENPGHVVPLQGNWWNPQSQQDSEDTWIGYVIDTVATDTPVVTGDFGRYYRACKANIHLTFIGMQAEDFAHSILWWPLRQDIIKLIDDSYKGQINNKSIRIFSSLYMQEGLNNTLCWNVNLVMSYNEEITIDNKLPLRHADLVGNLIIGGQDNG